MFLAFAASCIVEDHLKQQLCCFSSNDSELLEFSRDLIRSSAFVAF